MDGEGAKPSPRKKYRRSAAAFSLSLPADMLEALDYLARKEGRSRSGQVRFAIAQMIRERRSAEQPKETKQ
jgi:metal-responsive CopG/Arc/MetJ family transcriptional regulator